MNIWLLLILGILILEMGATMAQHGKPKEGYTNFWTTLISHSIIFACTILAVRNGGLL